MTTAPKAQPELPPPLPVISEALFGTVPIRRGPVLGDGGHLHMDNAMVQRLSEACKAHQADRELSSADSNILELAAVVRRRQAVRPFRALDLLHCQRPSAFTRDPSAGSHQFLLAVRTGKARQTVACRGFQIVTLPAFVRVQRLGHSQDSGALENIHLATHGRCRQAL